jgi:hypothetical protein
MREKKWVDCPVCGAQGSMKYTKDITTTLKSKNYKPIVIKGLAGYFCSKCKDGFYNRKSNNHFNSKLAEEKAKQDSTRIPASELLNVDDIAQKLDVSRQRVHQMMDEGKLHYVFVRDKKIPTTRNEKIFKSLRKREHYYPEHSIVHQKLAAVSCSKHE